MNIQKITEELSEVLNDNGAITEDYEEITMDSVVDEVCEAIRNQYDKDNGISIDTWITEELDGHFAYTDDIIELFKEISSQYEHISSEIQDAVWGELKGRVEDELQDLIEKENEEDLDEE